MGEQWVPIGDLSQGSRSFDYQLDTVRPLSRELFNPEHLYCCVWGGLSAFWQFVEFSLLWRFLAVCGFVQVACQGFLVSKQILYLT